MRDSLKLRIDSGFCLILAFMLLVLPLQWLVAAIAAAAIHELAHILAIRLCSGRISSFSVTSYRARIDVLELTPGKELFCSLAGPAVGLLTVLLYRTFPRLAVCAAIQTAYNLLPVFPMDGGRALKAFVFFFFPRLSDKICMSVSVITLILISLMCIYAAIILRLGMFPLLFAAILWYQSKIHLAKNLIWRYNSINLQKR